MNLPATFLSLATRMSAAFGGPFYAGAIVDAGNAVYDDGGSIVTPAMPTRRPCMVQIDSVTEAMRQADGYADGDVRFIILSASFNGPLDTDARVEVTGGPMAGAWLVSSLTIDPAGIGWVGRGRRAA